MFEMCLLSALLIDKSLDLDRFTRLDGLFKLLLTHGAIGPVSAFLAPAKEGFADVSQAIQLHDQIEEQQTRHGRDQLQRVQMMRRW